MKKLRYDVIIAGGGSAGCAAANVFCKAGLSVALLEAGPDYGPKAEGRWPKDLLDPRFDPDSHDWGYYAERLDGSRFIEPRAKVIGGCSSHNDCAAIWGVPRDYDAWAEAGNPGWRYEDLFPLIQQIEGTAGDSVTPYRGTQGPLYTKRMQEEELSLYQRAFIEASLNEGFGRVVDMGGPEPGEGVASYHGNVKDTERWNAAFAFLDPVRGNPNLTIWDHTMVDRVVIEGARAEALIVKSRGEDVELRADTILLSTGSHGTPPILMRSGVGPREVLKEIGIPESVVMEGVGRNLHDHPSFYISYKPTDEGWERVVRDLGEDSVYRGQVILRARSPVCQEDLPFDLHLLPSQVPRTLESRTLQGFICHMAARSRGRVWITSRDPNAAPRIATNYLTDEGGRDKAALIYGLRLLRRVAQAAPMSSLIESELEPWESKQTDEEIVGQLRESIVNYSHASGTCKMGPESDAGSVVDARGRVHGMENLYVADASIIPLIPLANTNLTSMLIGMKVASGLVG